MVWCSTFWYIFQGELTEGVAYVRQMREFFEYLDQPSHPTAWTYMEDELFMLQHPELKEDLGPNVSGHY